MCAHWPAAPAYLLDTACGPAATADAPAPTPAAAATPATSPTSTTPPTAPLASTVAPATPPAPRRADEPIAIIYTSGTSGDSKGVVLTVGNLDHMLPCVLQRIDELMASHAGQKRVFHYLPFCFAGSWLLLLSSLSRGSLLTLATDIDTLPDQLRVAAPHYFQNVPLLLKGPRYHTHAGCLSLRPGTGKGTGG